MGITINMMSRIHPTYPNGEHGHYFWKNGSGKASVISRHALRCQDQLLVLEWVQTLRMSDRDITHALVEKRTCQSTAANTIAKMENADYLLEADWEPVWTCPGCTRISPTFCFHLDLAGTQITQMILQPAACRPQENGSAPPASHA